MKAIIWSLYFHKCLYQVPIGGWQLKHIYKFHFLLKAGKSLIVQDHSYSLPKAWKDSFFSAKLVLHHLNKGKDSYWHTRKITNFIHQALETTWKFSHFSPVWFSFAASSETANFSFWKNGRKMLEFFENARMEMHFKYYF